MPRRRVSLLPGYSWSPSTHNYRDLSTGRFVSRSDVLGLLRDVSSGLTDTMGALGEAAARGDLTPRQFIEAMRITTKQAYSTHSALALGGWDRMGPEDWGRVGGHLGSEYRHLTRFAEQIRDGELSEAQIRARARLYSDGSFKVYYESEQEAQARDGAAEERWITVGDEKVCPICRELEERGWESLGNLPLPPVHPGCRCDKDYRKPSISGAEGFTVTEVRRPGASLPQPPPEVAAGGVPR